MSDSKKSKIQELLDQLQVESWQLELLISGFAIFLVGASFEPVSNFSVRLGVIDQGLNAEFSSLTLFANILIGCLFFIFVNLILHVVFRGLWISAIGLRSISGEIDFEELNFASPFDKFMKKRLKSFDHFIQRLEDISSVIFAFTFLIVFMMVAFGFFFFFTGVLAYFIGLMVPESKPVIVAIIVGVFFTLYGLSAFLYFLDFITLGYFKRKKWIARWYYPIYRLFSVLTFSWLYRPLYYNLIDNKFGRRIGLFLFPYLIIVSILGTLKAHVNYYIPDNKQGLELLDVNFEDERNKNEVISAISIPSKYISNDYLELFIKYFAKTDDQTIEKLCPDFIPDRASGLETTIIQVSGFSEVQYTSADSLLDCVAQLYKVYLNDSLYQNLDFFYYIDPNFSEEGIKTILDVSHLPRGKSLLKIEKQFLNAKTDSLRFRPFTTTPIWIE